MSHAKTRWWRFAVAAALTAASLLPMAAAPAEAGAGGQSAIILLDVNRSLAGSGITAEREAAFAYARALPADVRVGLITFNSSWQMALAPTTDRAKLIQAVTSIRLSGGVSGGIYQALPAAQSALRSLGAAPSSRLLVLSDGETLAGPALTSSAPVDVVTWFLDGDDHLGLLRTLASTTGGQLVAPANVASLAARFSASAQAAGPARSGGFKMSRRLLLVLALVFLALTVLALMVVGSVTGGDRRRQLVRQIERYGPKHSPAPPAAQEGAVARGTVGLTAQLLKSSKTEQGLARRLDLAGIGRKPAEWALLGVALSAVVAAALTLLAGSALIGVPIGVVLGWLAMRIYTSVRISRRRAAFATQLPDVLQFIAGALRSGFSLGQAFDAAVREGTEPAAGEFGRALAEARVGVDLDVALSGVADRMASNDMQWTVMAIRIQREVGGNLAEVIGNTIGTIRERAYLHRQVRALSAEGRLSAYILIALPVVMFLWLFLTDRSYVEPLYTTLVGLVMLGVSLVLFAIGVLWIRAAIKVEV